MIIFDLDGTLADCEHRRHLVDPSKSGEYESVSHALPDPTKGRWLHKTTGERFEPDYKAFYEACDKDEPIYPVIQVFTDLKVKFAEKTDVYIWSGRCESVRKKTEEWIYKNIPATCAWNMEGFLKMRPIGDNTPDEQLKERWLMERYNHISLNTETGKVNWIGHDIDFVFDDRPKVIKMWRRRGIFVFNCCQHDGEF